LDSEGQAESIKRITSDAVETFFCFRCNDERTSTNRYEWTTSAGVKTICNGCNGNLLSARPKVVNEVTPGSTDEQPAKKFAGKDNKRDFRPTHPSARNDSGNSDNRRDNRPTNFSARKFTGNDGKKFGGNDNRREYRPSNSSDKKFGGNDNRREYRPSNSSGKKFGGNDNRREYKPSNSSGKKFGGNDIRRDKEPVTKLV
jgi:hypothetical protein